MKEEKTPLVSVVVITYNSSKTVIETLESIKSQTYKNIELIISDDASLDNTVEICNKWIVKNKDVFVRIELVSSAVNTGISSNANRGVLHSKGTWIKLIAADDKLLPNCICENITFVKTHPKYDLLFSKFEGIGDKEEANNYFWKDCGTVLTTFSLFDLKTVLYQRNFLPAATAFYSRSLFDMVGGYVESIPFLEDWPFWIKVIDKGFNVGFLNNVTVEYRFSQQSISQPGVESRNPKFIESSQLAKNFALHHLANLSVLAWFYKATTYNKLPKNSFLWKLLHYINILNPFYYHNIKVHRRFFNAFSEK